MHEADSAQPRCFTLSAGRDRREIGHLHGSGLLDIPFSRPLRDQAVAAALAQPYHIFPQSASISLFLRAEADIPNAVALLRLNYKWLADLG